MRLDPPHIATALLLAVLLSPGCGEEAIEPLTVDDIAGVTWSYGTTSGVEGIPSGSQCNWECRDTRYLVELHEDELVAGIVCGRAQYRCSGDREDEEQMHEDWPLFCYALPHDGLTVDEGEVADYYGAETQEDVTVFQFEGLPADLDLKNLHAHDDHDFPYWYAWFIYDHNRFPDNTGVTLYPGGDSGEGPGDSGFNFSEGKYTHYDDSDIAGIFGTCDGDYRADRDDYLAANPPS